MKITVRAAVVVLTVLGCVGWALCAPRCLLSLRKRGAPAGGYTKVIAIAMNPWVRLRQRRLA